MSENRAGSEPKIKICGVFRSEDASYINDARPDYVGFVFVESSRRYVAPALAAALRKTISPEIESVGVFQNAEPEFIAGLVNEGTIDAIQLHGAEDGAYISRLRILLDTKKRNADSVIIIKSIPVTDMDSCARLAGRTPADILLFDNAAGGSGQPFDLSVLASLVESGALKRRPFFIAGGVNIGNIRARLALNPYGIDVSSGVETNGVKDREKILEIVGIVRSQPIVSSLKGES